MHLNRWRVQHFWNGMAAILMCDEKALRLISFKVIVTTSKLNPLLDKKVSYTNNVIMPLISIKICTFTNKDMLLFIDNTMPKYYNQRSKSESMCVCLCV